MYKSLSKLRAYFFIGSLIPVAVFILAELNVLERGVIPAISNKAIYIVETLTIGLTVVLIPLSLKMFHRKVKNDIAVVEDDKEKEEKYIKWSFIRISLLFISIYASLLCYILTTSNTGSLCMLICYVAMLFCIPSVGAMHKDLDVNKE